ncbi:Abi family protein [Corynebacterium glutamicum]|uniref:Abi family protein n=1 Tax=Corynebacterium glutamicum TaxID=1718 RepID=UPI0016A3ABA5|nr:Abi family protein [Corynebacterium glutamicum]NII86166.1 hypothetical protein [Corynebacterium glutamicum]
MDSGSKPSTFDSSNLYRLISTPRFASFLDNADGDKERAFKLYIWNRDLSVSFLGDMAILEVSLRNAMNDTAVKSWGTHWYQSPDIALDDRSCRQLAEAWNRLPKSVRSRPNDTDVPGRLITHCMFGFWTNLLDAGDYIGKPPRKVRVNYEDTLHVFKHAFPGGRGVARDLRRKGSDEAGIDFKEPTFTRAWVHGICKSINELRNRVAHHEPLINGFPLSGQNRRMSAEEGCEQCRLLAHLIDRDLAVWFENNSRVPLLLSQRPI